MAAYIAQGFKPKDFIALLVILGGIVLKVTGHGSEFDGVVGLVLGYYFVKRQAGVDTGL